MKPDKLLIASGNRGKIAEFGRLLEGLKIRVIGPDGLGSTVPEYEEHGSSFSENARGKALHWLEHAGLPVLADDSGLCVDFLDGAPGVYSARFAGPDATDSDNVRKLLGLLEGVPDQQRTAAFHCCLALCLQDGSLRTFEGECRGRITTAPRGSGGFGYDPVFFYPPEGHTFAELPAESKNRVSHRGAAIGRLLHWLEERSG